MAQWLIAKVSPTMGVSPTTGVEPVAPPKIPNEPLILESFVPPWSFAQGSRSLGGAAGLLFLWIWK